VLGKSGYNPVVQLVGLLHDVVEDTGRTVDDVRAYFGDTVAQIVAELTEDDRIRAYSSPMVAC
jgi:GTP pyrophosphokinase